MLIIIKYKKRAIQISVKNKRIINLEKPKQTENALIKKIQTRIINKFWKNKEEWRTISANIKIKRAGRVGLHKPA